MSDQTFEACQLLAQLWIVSFYTSENSALRSIRPEIIVRVIKNFHSLSVKHIHFTSFKKIRENL